MQVTQYGLKVTLSVPYELAVQRATEALKTEGFGVYENGHERERGGRHGAAGGARHRR